MRPHARFVRLVSILVLVLLFGGAFPARYAPPVHASGLWYVAQSGDDDDNDCLSPATACATINAALDKITPGDTILVDSGTYTYVHVTDEMAFAPTSVVVGISQAVTLSGGWNAAFTAQTGYTTIDGEHAYLGVYIGEGDFAVTIQRFIVQNSNAGIQVYSASLTLEHSIIQNNGDSNYEVGGILSSSSPALTILDSAIRGNTGYAVGGIRISAGDPAVIFRNSSLSGNSGVFAGGFDNSLPHSGVVYIENSTVSGNFGENSGILYGAFDVSSSTITDNTSLNGAGVIVGSAILRNTIISGNTSLFSSTCSNMLTSAGYNLLGNLNGCSITLQPGDQTEVDPGLGSLEGSPAYHYLLPSSPAIDAGNPAGCLDHSGASLDVDQRGLARLGRCDIGAVEFQPLDYSTFSATPKNAHPGQVITYTALLGAAGSEPLTGVALANTLPAGLTYLPNSLQASAGAAQFASGKVTWSGDLVPGTDVTLTYQARAGAVAKVENKFVLTHGLETNLRSVVTSITPWVTYLPTVNKPCPAFYADYFTDPNSGWFVGSNNNYAVQYLPGEYQILMKATNHYLLTRAPSNPIPDTFQVSVDVRNPSEIYGSYGLMFGAAEDWSTFFTFEILPDQTWYVWSYNYYYGWDIETSGVSTAIRTGGQPNTLTVGHASYQTTLSINNVLVGSFYDYQNFSGRFAGLTSQSFDHAPLDVRFTNFYIPESSCTTTTLQSAAPVHPGGIFSGPSNRPAPGK